MLDTWKRTNGYLCKMLFFVCFHVEVTLVFMSCMCATDLLLAPLSRKQEKVWWEQDAYITGNLSSVKLFNAHNFINRQEHPPAQGNQVAGRQWARGMSDKQVVSIPAFQLSRDAAGNVCRHKYSCDTSWHTMRSTVGGMWRGRCVCACARTYICRIMHVRERSWRV